MLFVLTGLSTCTEEEPPLIKEETTKATTDKEQSNAEGEKPPADIAHIIYNPDL